MKKINENVIALIRSGLNGEIPPTITNAELNDVFALAKGQQILSLVMNGASKNPELKNLPAFKEYTSLNLSLVHIDILQTYETEVIAKAFSENGVDYMLLKGAVLKGVYPLPELRSMGDVDILIREEQSEQAIKVMQGLGYEFRIESDHEYVFNKDNVHVELHKRLIPSYNLDFDKYYGESWDFAIPRKNHRYSMSNEEFFIYIFTHFAKHYRDKGVGIKYVVDFYVFAEKNSDMMFEYVENRLKELKLYDFYLHIKELIDVLFKGAKPTEMTDFLTEKLLSDGVYGKDENLKLSGALKISKKHKHFRFRSVLRGMFPTFIAMKSTYPVLEKHAFLLPYYYIVRLLGKIFHPKKAAKRIKEINEITPEKIAEYQNELNYVGLDYYFNENK